MVFLERARHEHGVIRAEHVAVGCTGVRRGVDQPDRRAKARPQRQRTHKTRAPRTRGKHLQTRGYPHIPAGTPQYTDTRAMLCAQSLKATTMKCGMKINLAIATRPRSHPKLVRRLCVAGMSDNVSGLLPCSFSPFSAFAAAAHARCYCNSATAKASKERQQNLPSSSDRRSLRSPFLAGADLE